MSESKETTSEPEEIIYDSEPSKPNDDFWLEQGRRLLTESFAAVSAAANSLMTALGVLQGIYLGILGFAKFIPEEWSVTRKAVFILPLLLWLVALYLSLQVAMTRKVEVYFHSPDDIRQKSNQLLKEKQRRLEWAFWLLTLGLLTAFGLLLWRLNV
jgi:hypothetical protein